MTATENGSDEPQVADDDRAGGFHGTMWFVGGVMLTLPLVVLVGLAVLT